MGPPYNQKEEKWKFHIWSVGYQNRVKRVIGVHFWRNFWKMFKNENFIFWNFWKRSNFEAFFRPSTLITEHLKKNLLVAYVHIEYATYQFSEESKGGVESLRYRKKHGPERVKEPWSLFWNLDKWLKDW